jgi:hypothetical protein
MSDQNAVERAKHGEVRTMHREPSAAWPHLDPLHPAWRAFFRFCSELQHGEIEHLKVQDGLPVLAELVSKKVKFSE